MTNIKLVVNGSKVRAEVEGILTSGSVGIPVTIQYDNTWDGLTKNLVCTSGKWGPTGKPRTIANIDTTATVAHEVMIADNQLYLAVEGRNEEGTIVIPTIWADCGKIYPGASVSADPSAKPTLPIWAQLEHQIEDLKENGSLNNGNTDSDCAYTLPVATAETLGGVMPAKKTEAMTQTVGVDANGRLYTEPGASGGTDDYAVLNNKPQINGVTLDGNKTNSDLGIGNPTDEQVATAVGIYLDEHPEATTTVADGSVTEEKTTFFTRNLMELIGEMEVGFGGNSMAGYHKKTFAVEPGKTYVFYPGQWNTYFNADMAEITEGWTLENNILTIPADSPLRYIRPTVQDTKMTDTFPCCYVGSDNIGQIARGSCITTFDYTAEKETPVLQMSQPGNLIRAEECTLNTGAYYYSGYIPVTPGEKYYCAPVIGMLEFYNRYKAVWRNLNYDTSSIAQTLFNLGVFSPNGGTVVTGQGGGVYTIPEWCKYVRCNTTLTDGVPDAILVKASRKVTKEQLQDTIIYSAASQDSVEAFVKSQHLSGLTLCCLGDSVTNMSGYGALVAAKYGMTNISGGTDGAGYIRAAGLADNQIAYNKVNSLDADTDVVVLMFGTNDISNGREIGTFTDNDLTTLYGALRQTFNLLVTKFNGKRIGVVTSPQRNFNTCEYDKWKQYNDTIKRMAMLYKIPVLDGEYAGLVYGLANDYSHFTDDVHPSAVGSEALAYNIGKFIESLPIYHRNGA